jgi:undecaprenyl-diphosphatase
MLSLAAIRRRAPDGLSLARREIGPIVMVLATAAFLLAFRRIAEAVTRGDARAFDRAVLQALSAPGDPRRSLAKAWLNIAASDFGAMGSVTVLAFIVVLVCGLFLSLKRWREAALLFLASGGGLALTNVLKDAFNRGRPPLTAEVAAGLNASFPSGHAVLTATVYLTLGVLIGHFAERRLIRLYALGAAVLLTVLVGLSRIYMGVHWCTDVLAGWCVGAAWALLWWGVALAWERATRRRLSTADYSARLPGT